MPFMPVSTPKKEFQVNPVGRPGAKIALVGDFVSGWDINSNRPFNGPDGKVLDACLHNAGLIRGELYITYLCKAKIGNPYSLYSEDSGSFNAEGSKLIDLLREELEAINPNIIVTMGPAAFCALCNNRRLATYRGYVHESTLLPGKKVIPTFSPWTAVRGQYLNRYMIAADLKKTKEESYSPILTRPNRELILNFDNIEDLLSELRFYETVSIVGCDIEVINYEVSCLSFSSTPTKAVVADIAGRWSIDEELAIWRAVSHILGNPNSVKVFQNGMFDITFLLDRNGIVTRGEIHDTMVGHSVLFPELQKSLGFLGSIYCGAQEYWKDTVKFINIKDES